MHHPAFFLSVLYLKYQCYVYLFIYTEKALKSAHTPNKSAAFGHALVKTDKFVTFCNSSYEGLSYHWIWCYCRYNSNSPACRTR